MGSILKRNPTGEKKTKEGMKFSRRKFFWDVNRNNARLERESNERKRKNKNQKKRNEKTTQQNELPC